MGGKKDKEASVLKTLEIAKKIWNDGQVLRRIREKQGLTREDLARTADIPLSRVAAYERRLGQCSNFWLLLHDLREFKIDYNLIDDDDYMDEVMDPKKDDKKNHGPKGKRDPWYGYPKGKFQRWAHRKYIEKLSDKEREKPRPRERH